MIDINIITPFFMEDVSEFDLGAKLFTHGIHIHIHFYIHFFFSILKYSYLIVIYLKKITISSLVWNVDSNTLSLVWLIW